MAPSKVEGTRGEEKQKHPLQQIPCPGKNSPLSGGSLLRGFCIPRKGGGGPLERKCKKEESAQRGVWGEIPETTHALKERDSRKDRVGKGGGGGSREGQKKKVVPSREILPNIAYRNIFLWRCLRERRWRSGRYMSSPPLSRFSRGLERARGGDRTQAKKACACATAQCVP